MVTAELIFDDDIFEAIAGTARRLPTLMATALKRQQPRIRKFVLNELREVPPRLPVLPFVWSTDPAANARARRWYFANKVGNNPGGRYQRTGELPANWEVIIDLSTEGASISVENDAPGARYVYGDRQVPSHTRTGWFRIDDRVIELSERVQDAVIDTWFTIEAPELL